jgi:hypothetical protein
MDLEWQFIPSVTLSEGLNLENLDDSAIDVWVPCPYTKICNRSSNVSKGFEIDTIIFSLLISNVIYERLSCF